MEEYLRNEKSGGMSKTGIMIGVLVAILILGGIAGVVYMLPKSEQKQNDAMAGAFRAGSPEFEAYRKEIIVTNDPQRLQESRTGIGDIVMRMGARVRNKGDKTITALEISVGMVDTKNKLIRDKTYVVIPGKYPKLDPEETIDIEAAVAGFKDDDDRANSRWLVTGFKLEGK